ncbi:hypothetical protein ACU8OG_08330 [Rhizobium leguminosarum]
MRRKTNHSHDANATHLQAANVNLVGAGTMDKTMEAKGGLSPLGADAEASMKRNGKVSLCVDRMTTVIIGFHFEKPTH